MVDSQITQFQKWIETQVKSSQILKALPARILFPNENQLMREAFFSSCFSGHIYEFEIDGEKKCA